VESGLTVSFRSDRIPATAVDAVDVDMAKEVTNETLPGRRLRRPISRKTLLASSECNSEVKSSMRIRVSIVEFDTVAAVLILSKKCRNRRKLTLDGCTVRPAHR
jgi:hypothetical protein